MRAQVAVAAHRELGHRADLDVELGLADRVGEVLVDEDGPGASLGGQAAGDVDDGAVDVAVAGQDVAEGKADAQGEAVALVGHLLVQAEGDVDGVLDALADEEDLVAEGLHDPAVAPGDDVGAHGLEALEQ